MEKSDKKWKKVTFEFGNPTDLNPSVLVWRSVLWYINWEDSCAQDQAPLPDEHHYRFQCHPCRIYTLHLTSLGPISSFCRQTWVSLNTYKSTRWWMKLQNAPRTKRPTVPYNTCIYSSRNRIPPAPSGPRSPSKEAEPEVGCKNQRDGW